MITIEINPPPNLDRIIRILGTIPNALNRAGKSAVRRTIKGGKEDAAQKVKARYTIAVGEVLKTIRTTASGLTGEMKSKGSRNPLKKFLLKPKIRVNPQPPIGLWAQNVKGQGGDIPHSFSKYSGGIFERTTPERFPIRSFTGPSAPSMLNSPPVSSYIVSKMQERMEKNLNHECLAVLGGFL